MTSTTVTITATLDGDTRTATLTVNPPPVESDLTKLGPAQVASLLPKRASDASGGSIAATVGQTALWPWIALAMLAFLLVEGVMVRKV